MHIYVRPEFRRQGLATAMVKDFFRGVLPDAKLAAKECSIEWPVSARMQVCRFVTHVPSPNPSESIDDLCPTPWSLRCC